MVETSEKVELLVTVPLPEEELEQIRQLSPRLRITPFYSRKIEEIPSEFWGRAEILYTDSVLPTLEMAPNLKMIQFHWAGLDQSAEAIDLSTQGVQVATSSGVATSQIAEYVVMMMLALGHRLPEMIQLQSKGEWIRNRWEKLVPRELRGSTVGIVGYGSIGREIARQLHPFGVQILAAKRNVMRPMDSGYTQEGLGDPEGNYFQRLYPIQALASMLKVCDFVVICLPLTEQTKNLVNDEMLRSMKPEAYLVDIGRGGIIDEGALLAALQEHRLAGAALDVFAEEPLPAQSPFWHLPNVFITPHVAGISAQYRKRAVELLVENVDRYLNGLPILNVFHPEEGY
jgi:phosphoglycerate dehydrogenase-like enzyme